mgnify:CR=1 FL=1
MFTLFLFIFFVFNSLFLFVYLCDALNGHPYVISSYFDSYSLELSINGRSHGNILQMNTEPSLLELCWVQLDIHAIKQIQKLRKFRANEYRVKFTWTMLSAAEILYQKKRPNINHWALSARKKTHINVYRKNYRKNSLEKYPHNYLTRLLLFSCK